MLVFVRQRLAITEQKLAAHQPDAVAVRDIEASKVSGIRDVDLDLDHDTVGGDRRLDEKRVQPGCFRLSCFRAQLERRAIGGAGAENDKAAITIDNRPGVAFKIASAKPDYHRHAARPRQHRDVARRTAGGKSDAAAPAPIGFEELAGG